MRIESELDLSEEFASVVASTFNYYIGETLRTQFAVGTAIASNSNWSQNDIQDYLENLTYLESRVIGYTWLSSKGDLLATTIAWAQDNNNSDQEHIQEIINGGESSVSNLIKSGESLIISIAQSIRVNHELEGILIAYLDTEKIESFFATDRSGSTSAYGIIDQNGYMIFRKGSPKIGFEARKISETSPAWGALAGEVVRTEVFKSGLDGDLRMGVNYPIESLGWATFATISVKELLATKNKAFQDELLTFFTIFIFLFLLVIFLSHKLVSSIDTLIQTSKEIMRGNLNAKTNFASNDPLAIVGQTFDQMTEELNQRMIEIDERNQLKTQFLSTVSHELKTPLNIILGVNQLMEKLDYSYQESLSVPLRKYLNMQKQNCYRLLRLINNLIDVGKAENQHLQAHPVNCNIVKVVEDITLSIVDYAAFKNLELVFDTEIEEKTIAFDKDMVERMMLNLLSNAIKFTKQNGKIEVTIYQRNEMLIISVKDNGIGIPEDKIDKIFDRFSQVDSTLSRKSEGSGIGLSLVKYLVELHDGNISVVSELGIGSEFIIELPVKYTEEESLGLIENYSTNIERIKIEFSDIYTNSNIAEPNQSHKSSYR